jgi:hypothetical protein
MSAWRGVVAMVGLVAVVCAAIVVLDRISDGWRKPEPDLSRCAFCGQKTNF